MKYTISAILSLVTLSAFIALPRAWAAASSASAVVMVRCTVVPNVTVSPVEATVDAGEVRMGAFSMTCSYRVQSNSPELQFFVEQSPLFKADDPTKRAVAPISVNMNTGVALQAAGGKAAGGHGNTLAFAGNGAAVQGMPTYKTEAVMFSSSQGGNFNEQVSVKCSWVQTDAQKPPGEYAGVVRLTALVLPSPGRTS